MKSFIGVVAFVAFIATVAIAQDSEVAETKLKVFGNCGMCKTRIEKALKIKEVKYAKWDKKSKVLSLAYYSSAITLDSLQHRLAAVGHDTEKFKAPDAVYNDLPGCCLYRDGDNTH
jgi:hypothetical protein